MAHFEPLIVQLLESTWDIVVFSHVLLILIKPYMPKLQYPPVLSKSDRFYSHLPGPLWTQGQRMVNGFRSQYCRGDLPPHMTAGYQSFERETFYRGTGFIFFSNHHDLILM